MSGGAPRWVRVGAAVAALSLVVGACGGGDDDAGGLAECPPGGCDLDEVADASVGEVWATDVMRPVQEGPWPVVVVVHGLGGGLYEKALARAIAARGAVAYNIEVPQDPPFLESAEAVACAVRFARSTAPEHGGDGERVTLVGFSLGAVLGNIVGLSGEDLAASCGWTEGSAEPDAVVAYEGPYDWARHVYGQIDLPALERDDPATWTAMDPYAHLGGNTDLEVRLLAGVDEDDAWYEVRPEVAEEWGNALDGAGYEVELTLVDGAGHKEGFEGQPQFDAIVEQVVEATR